MSTLFFTEMWERFSFYGMRAIFVPFMLLSAQDGGLGFSREESGAVLAMYMASVYMMSLPGGWIADKFLGQRNAVTVGGLIIMLGHILLALPAVGFFYAGLVCLVLGTGFLKPNVSTMVGQLYAKDDPRRDGGFSIFYMGINVGAFAAPIICGWLARDAGFKAFLESHGIPGHYSWHLAFGAAAVGMAAGLIQYWLGGRHLDGVGLPAVATPEERRKHRYTLAGIIAAVVGVPGALWLLNASGYALTKERLSNIFGVILLAVFVSTFVMLYLYARTPKEKKGVLAMIALAIGCVSFFALFEQAAGTMNAFAEERTRTVAFGKSFPAEWFQSVNSVFIIILSPVFSWFFTWIVARKLPFNDIFKFGTALVLMAVAFAIMLPAAGSTGVSPWYLIGFYFFSTLAELFLSPVGLSSMSKLAPPSAAGLVMGVWFLSTSNGDYIAGRVHGLIATYSESGVFGVVIVGALLVAVLMAVLGWYFTTRVPLESLQSESAGGPKEALLKGVHSVTGNGIAGFATAASLWPVVLTDAGLGLGMCVILGPAAVLMCVKGIAETREQGVSGRVLSQIGIALVAVAALVAARGFFAGS